MPVRVPARLLVVVVLLAAGVVADPPGRAEAEGTARPSLVVINTDDQRFDALAACLPAPGLGRPAPLDTCPMPHVRDDLIAHGVTFTESFVTTALCCPSRASLLTGQYAHRTGVLTNEKPNGGFSRFRLRQSSTLATWLHDAGYRTGLVGKYMNQYTACQTPPCQSPPGWDDWHAEVTDGDVDYTSFELNDNGAITAYPGYSTTVLGRHATAFVQSTPAAQPLFLYFAPFAPHPRAVPAPGDEAAFDTMPPWRPPSYDTVAADQPLWVRDPDNNHALTPEQRLKKDAEHQREMASLVEIDRQVHALVTALDDAGRLDHTLLLFTSDNGLSWGEHAYFDKKNCEFDECHRVPFVVRYDPLTAGEPGGRVDPAHPVLNVDVAPTLAEAAGVLGADAMDGRSLLPLLTAAPGDDPADWRTSLLGEDYGGLISCSGCVRTPTLQLVRTTPGAVGRDAGHAWKYVRLCALADDALPCSPTEWELYDETADPYELDNRAGEAATSSLQAALDDLLTDVASTQPPAVAFTGGPPAATNQPAWSIPFSAPGASRLWCSLDGAARAPCTSPLPTGPLPDGTHSLTVVAEGTDLGRGVAGTSAPAVKTWVVDTAAPDTSISDGPSGTVTPTAASFTFVSTEPGGSFTCSLDGGTPAACVSPASFDSLTQGGHTFTVAAVDAAGNADASPASRSWTIDSRPETTITNGPAEGSFTRSGSATFRFTSSVAGSTFECRLDGGAWNACTAPFDLTGLADATHTFAVRATNAGFVDPTPATRSWTVDGVAPETSITDGPPSATNAAGPYRFGFAASEPGATFACRVDGGTWTPCASPQDVAASEGAHAFQVRATDAAGNTEATPASRSWTVDTAPPDTTITGGPSGLVGSTSATFTFSSSEGGPAFACSLDGGAAEPCGSPVTFDGLGQGAHTLEVAAADAAGNSDATPATRSWTVDAVAPPQPTFSSTPPDPSGPSVSFSFGDAEAGASLSCALDGAAPAGCTSPRGFSSLGPGPHTFEVRASDAAGNVSSAATYAWTVKGPPVIESLEGPPAATDEPQATFTFSADDPEAAFACSLDGAPASPCSSPLETTVTEGTHTFTVVATNGAGSSSPRSVEWTLDTAAPAVTMQRPPADALLTSNAATVKWSASDPAPSSGSPAFQLLEGRGVSGTLAPVASPSGHSAVRSQLPEGVTTCWAIVATDPAGNTGRSPRRCAAVPLDDRDLTVGGPTATRSSAGAFDGTLTVLDGPGASAGLSFTGRRVGVLFQRGPSYGRARVVLDGTPVKTVDLYASSVRDRRYLWTTTFGASGNHALAVQFTGKRSSASGGAAVAVDGVAWIGDGAGRPAPGRRPRA